MTIDHYANRFVCDLVAYEPGKPIDETARELGLDPSQIVKLASNENPLGPSPLAKIAMREAIEGARSVNSELFVDLSATTGVDGACVGLLVLAMGTFNPKSLHLINPSKRVARIFARSGAGFLLAQDLEGRV